MTEPTKDVWLEGVVQRNDRDLKRYLSQRIGNRAEVEDLSQEIYLRLLRIERKDLIRSPEALLFRVASNAVYEWRLLARNRLPHSPTDLEDLESREREPAEDIWRAELACALTAALEHLSPKCRAAVLLHVAKDASRPFIVVTDLAIAKAIGTRFSVYRSQTGTIVTVEEGRVLVHDKQATTASGPAEHLDAVEVTPGTQAEAQPGRPVQMRQANVARTFAWRERRLVFEGEPLSSVVEEFNRYNSPPLVISDARLREQHISGVFGANDPESLVDFLVKGDHIAITHNADGAILIGGDPP